MKLFSVFLIILVVLFSQGCSTGGLEVKKSPIVFPSLPEEPKILYLGPYRGVIKTESDVSVFDVLLGEKSAREKVESNIVKPYGVGIKNGVLYVSDTSTRVVFAIDIKTKKTKHIGAQPGELHAPVGIAFDAKGMIYVSDSKKRAVLGFTKDGKLQFLLGDKSQFVKPTGIVVDEVLNRLYVVDTGAHKFSVFDLATKELLYEIGKRGKGEGEFNFPTNIAIDKRNGNIIIVDTQNFRVQTFDNKGKFITEFGEVGDRPGMFARPKGVAVDSDGNIYVSDSAFSLIQIFSEKGELLLYFGSAGLGDAQFQLIAGIAIGENDIIAAADGFSGRVHLFQYLSDKWKKNNPKKYEELKTFKPEM